MLDAARGVVEGSGRHARMLGEKATALGQRNRMGQDLVYVFDPAARDTNEIVTNAQQGFALDLNLGLKEEVKMLHYGTGKRILNRDDCGANLAVLDQLENLR